MILRAPMLFGAGLTLIGAGLIAGSNFSGVMGQSVKSWLALVSGSTETAAAQPGVEPIIGPLGVGALGRIEPASRVRRITAPSTITMNRLDRLLVEEGEDVVAGQLIAEFADAASKHAAVAQSDAATAEAQTELARVRAAGRPEDIEAERDHIESLRFQQEIARADSTRAEALVPSGAGARAVAERADAAANRAAANLREAEARLISLSQPRPEDVAVAEAKLRIAQAAGESARAQLALSEVFAPISGKVLKVYARPGDFVGTEGLLDLANLDQLEVVADVYETDVSRVHIGAQADVLVPGATTPYHAEVREVGWLVKRTLEAGNDPTAAVDGHTVEVRLRLGEGGVAGLRQRIDAQVHIAIQP